MLNCRGGEVERRTPRHTDVIVVSLRLPGDAASSAAQRWARPRLPLPSREVHRLFLSCRLQPPAEEPPWAGFAEPDISRGESAARRRPSYERSANAVEPLEISGRLSRRLEHA